MRTITLATGVAVTLFPQRALLWPAEATLFVADLHVGKADVFQRAGIAVPDAVTQSDLERLSALLADTAAQRLVILGDFFHAAASQSPGVHEALAGWRAAHAAVNMLLITGNHDRHAGPPPADLRIVNCGESATFGPFHCVHAPQAEPALYTLCGQLHPVGVLTVRSVSHFGTRSARLPCFHVGLQQMILPAFSTFTGGKSVAGRRGDRIFVTTGAEIFEAAIG
jgi:DNA ligase-associated metallophosphoesterase